MEILDQQVETLIQQAPKDGVTPTLITVIAPLLKETARQLQCPEYHVLQGKAEGWIVTTLSNRTQPELEKSVIYAFSTREDAQEYQVGNEMGEILIVSVPIIQLLFQLVALKTVYSVIFFDQSHRFGPGKEIRCEDFRQQIQAEIATYRAQSPLLLNNQPPPDIA